MRRQGVEAEKSAAPDHTNLTVTHARGTPAKTRQLTFTTGLSPAGEYLVYDNSIDTLERAIKERVFFVKVDGQFLAPPQPDQGEFFTNIQPARDALRRLRKYSPPLTYEQFYCSFQGRKRTVYENATASLAINPVSRRDMTTADFVKAEKQLVKYGKVPVPRVIRPAHPRYNVTIGRYIKPTEKKLYKAIDTMFYGGDGTEAVPLGDRTVMKGLNSQQRGVAVHGAWKCFSDPVALGLDASRFDQHVSVPALKYETSTYAAYFPNDKSFRRQIRWQLTNRGIGRCRDGRLKYKIDGTRTSGVSNTASGNVLIMCSLVYSFMITVIKKRYRFINDGDDGTIIMEREDVQQVVDELPGWFVRMGFTMTLEPLVYNIENIEFCQARPVWVDGGYIMVRNLASTLVKDCISLKPLPTKSAYCKWLSAVAQSGLSLTGGIPVFQEFYSLLLRTSDGAKMLTDPTLETGLTQLAKGMFREYSNIHPRTRLSFWIAFGITPERQIAIEQAYSTLTLDQLESSKLRLPTRNSELWG